MQWVEYLEKAISGALQTQILDIQVTNIETKQPIFIDYDSIRLKKKQEQLA